MTERSNQDAHVCKARTPVARPLSIKDIARIAQVSHSTVSRALQGSRLVNPQTAASIRQIAVESGYRASAVARGLVTQKTRTVGVVVTTIADPFVGEVVSGIEEVANDQGYSVFLANSNADPEREQKVVQSFAERRVDGIVITASRVGALYAPMLSEMRVPVVLVNNRYPGAQVHSVLIQNVQASRLAVEHLLELGHRRIAYLGDRRGHEADRDRLAGYRQALEQAGIPFAPELVVKAESSPEGSGLALEQLLSLPLPPTAVFCYNDMAALGGLRAIHRHGLRVPEDISLVGFDDLPMASYCQPPLTTVRQPMRRMGVLAMESLVRLMAGQPSADIIEVPAELVVRESTATVREAT